MVRRLRRLAILAVLGAVGGWLWREFQGRREPASSLGSSGTGSGTAATTTPSGPRLADSAPTPTPTQDSDRSRATAAADTATAVDTATKSVASGADRIKGNSASMLYHTVDSPNYKRTKGEVWFDTEEEAQAAGYRRWDHKRSAGS